MKPEFAMKFFIVILAFAYSASAFPSISEVNSIIDKPYNTKSIVFVLDTTTNLEASFKKPGIFNDFGKFDNHTNYNYSLIQFNETGVAPIIQNSGLDSFSKALTELPPKQSSKYCERKSLSGIQEGLSVSLDDSLMVVLISGDSVEEDKKALLPQILSTIAEKRIRVLLIRNGTCHSIRVLPAEYQRIAAVGNGQMFELQPPDNLGKLLYLLMNSTRVDLLAIDAFQAPSKAAGNEVLVDETITEILISVYSPDNYNLRVFSPSGVEFKDLASSCSLYLDFSFLKVCRVQKPKPGKWKITVENNENYSLRVSATSNMKINFGFDEQQKPPITNLTFCQPSPDKTNNFFVNLDTLSPNATVSLAKMISKDGKEIESYKMKKVENTLNLYSSQVKFKSGSDQIFHLQINGKINGSSFQRITPVAFGSHSGNHKNKLRSCSLPYIAYEESEPTTTPEPVQPTENPDMNMTTESNETSTENTPSNAAISTTMTVLSVIGIILIVIFVIICLAICFKSSGSYEIQKMEDNEEQLDPLPLRNNVVDGEINKR